MGTRPLAPIALFIYKRPEHARRTIASLKACSGYAESPVYVFADGARTQADVAAVEATRAVAHELLQPRATFIEHAANQGLANSIIAGTTELCERHGRVVVVEDDLVLDPEFLRFLNEGLEAYEDQPQVMQIAGHMFDVPGLADSRQALFLPLTTSWGWATWKRAWDQFDPFATGWKERLTGEEARRFDLGGRYHYSTMLRRQMTGGIDSWAIRWYYSVFVRNGLVLYPPQSLARHEGVDGSGTHGRFVRRTGEVGRWKPETITMPPVVIASPALKEVADAIERGSQRDLGATIRMVQRRLLMIKPR